MSERVKKWTKGEWFANGYLVYGDAGNVPLTVATTRMERWKSKRPVDESQANAQLIAAAPALVWAAEGLINSVMERYELKSTDELTCPHMQELAKAISMAYGETQ